MSKCRVRTVIRYTHRALTTIHRMGKSPKSGALAAAGEGLAERHAVGEPGDQHGGEEAGEARQVRLHADAAEQDQDDRPGAGRATRADRPSESATGSSSWTYTGAYPGFRHAESDFSRLPNGMVMSAPSSRQWGVRRSSERRARANAPGRVSCRASAGPADGRGARPPSGRPPRASAAGLGRALLRAGRLAHGVGKGFQVVAAGAGRGRAVEEPDDLPAARGGEALGVLGAQVVAVGFGVGGERAEDRGRVGVDVRQRRDGGTAASGARTATYRAHDVGRYRTLERAATTLPQVTPPCRAVKRPTRPSGHTALTCADTARPRRRTA